MRTMLINGILKFFILFIILAETQVDAIQKCILFVHSLRNPKNFGCIGRLYIVMFGTHLFMVCVVLLLTNFWVLNSYTLLDALNNSLSILILNALHLMGTKFFMKFIYSSNSRITNNMEYLKFDFPLQEYEQVHSVTTYPLIINLLLSAVLLLWDRQVIAWVLALGLENLCLILVLFGVASSGMMLGSAAWADWIIRVFTCRRSRIEDGEEAADEKEKREDGGRLRDDKEGD